jgi:hypothetical protein
MKISERAVELMVERHKRETLSNVYAPHKTWFEYATAHESRYPGVEHVAVRDLLQALDEYQEAQMKGKEAQALNEVVKW